MNSNTPAKQKNNGLPQMSQTTRYAIYLISLLFIFSVGYSGYVVYQNKHNHKNMRFNLINLITGRDSTPTSLKTSSVAKQITEQNAQYSAPPAPIQQDDIAKNAQKLAIINFYSEYLDNKKAGQSQDSTLTKYGTASLASEYSDGTPAKDALTCASDLGASVNLIPTQEDDSPNPTYSVSFQDAQKKQLSYASVNLVQNNNGYAIDSVDCLQ